MKISDSNDAALDRIAQLKARTIADAIRPMERQPKVELVYAANRVEFGGKDRHVPGCAPSAHLLINGVDVGWTESIDVRQPSKHEVLAVTVRLLPSEYVVRVARPGEFGDDTMGGPPSTGTPADMRLSENKASNPGSMPAAGDPTAGDMPSMTHQLVAPPATCIEPAEYGNGSTADSM